MADRQAHPPSSLLDFFRLIGRLKTTKRTGWVYSDVHQPESVSDHMYRMALIAFSISPDPSRTPRLIKMALVHDLAEAKVGDIAPADNVPKQEKYRLEEAVMRHIRDDIFPNSSLGRELYNLWLEYELGLSDDAKLIKEIDKFEMIIQADEYERTQGKNLAQFFASTADAFHSPIMKSLNSELREQRQIRISQPSTNPTQYSSSPNRSGESQTDP